MYQLKSFITYVDQYFPRWKDRHTYVTPPIYIYEAKYVPSQGASNYDPECHGRMTSRHYTDSVEEHVLNAFVRFGDYSHQPMFIFPNFKFKGLVKKINKLQQKRIDLTEYQQETDLIIVHREYGIILVEVKSNLKDYDTYKKARNQLINVENLLYDDKHLSQYFLLDSWPKHSLFKKVIASPCQNEWELSRECHEPEYINLNKNHTDNYKNFSQWWDANIAKYRFLQWWLFSRSAYESTYYNLVPKLLCKQEFMYWNMSLKEIKDSLGLQITLEKQQIKEKVIVEEGSVLHSVWKHMTSEQYEVWIKERQVIYGPYGSGKTVLIQCKAADLALSGQNVFILLPTHQLVTSYKIFFDRLNSTSKYAPITVEEKTEIDSDEEEKHLTIQKQIKNWHKCSGKIMLVSLIKFNKNICLYEEFIKISHIFVDELLWLPFEPPPQNLEFSYIFTMICKQLKQNTYHVWITPHLYYFLTYLLHLKGVYDDVYLPRFDNYVTKLTTTFRTTKGIHDFIIQKEWQDLCKYVDREFKAFQGGKPLNWSLNKFFNNYSDIFQTVLCNSHGHHVTGPPVRIFNFDYDATIQPDEIMLNKFINFSAKVIASEVDRHCGVLNFKHEDIAVIVDTCVKDHIRIKAELLNHPKLKGYKLRSLDLVSMEKSDIVVICNSDDIASFEWPVVIHIKYLYDCNYRFGLLGHLTYFESYHHMIASRCTIQYIIIECKHKEDAYAWPHNKSLQKFKLWRQQNEGKKLEAETFHEYSKL